MLNKKPVISDTIVHPWFAWYPVLTTTGFRWLTNIWKGKKGRRPVYFASLR